jgi:hypothetical protein
MNTELEKFPISDKPYKYWDCEVTNNDVITHKINLNSKYCSTPMTGAYVMGDRW